MPWRGLGLCLRLRLIQRGAERNLEIIRTHNNGPAHPLEVDPDLGGHMMALLALLNEE